MRRCVLVAALLAGLFGAGLLPAQQILKVRENYQLHHELESKMRGHWKLVSMEKDGKSFAENELREQRLLISNDRMVVTAANEIVSFGYFKLDATTNPKRIDLVKFVSVDKTETLTGIVECDGETLRIAIGAGPDDPRPATFRGRDNPAIISAVFRRTK
jgi:uncharacterized protein (TIGR03067 family)